MRDSLRLLAAAAKHGLALGVVTSLLFLAPPWPYLTFVVVVSLVSCVSHVTLLPRKQMGRGGVAYYSTSPPLFALS